MARQYDPVSVTGWIFLMLLVVGANVAIQYVKRRTRATTAAGIAGDLGYVHREEAAEAPFLPFETLSRGTRRRTTNEISDPDDPSGARGFVFSSRIGRANDHDLAEHTCALLVTGWDAPHVRLDREGSIGRLVRSLGVPDVATGDPAFDARWKVRCDRPEYARELLHDRLRAWLTQLDDGWDSVEFEVGGDHLLAHVDGAHVERIPELIDLARHFKAAAAPG